MNKEERAIYMKEYRTTEKWKNSKQSSDKKYYLNNKEQVKENNKKWKENNLEKFYLNNKKWAQNNPDRIKIIQKQYRINKIQMLNLPKHGNQQKIAMKQYLNRKPGNLEFDTRPSEH